MAINIDKLKIRKYQLCGKTKTIEMHDMHEDLNSILSLLLRGKSITKENMLIEQMEINMDFVEPVMKPYATAILQIYKEKHETTTCSAQTPVKFTET